MKQTRITPEETKRLVDKLQSKYSITEIASELGVCTCTIYNWVSGRRQPKKIYIEKLKNMVEKISGGINGET